MPAKKENNVLAVQDSGFLSLANTDFAAIANEELAGLDLQLERIKIPVGGSTAFELPTENEDTELVKEFSAVILYHHPLNVYYASKYTGGNNPPDCGSYDALNGIGTPGGECKSCDNNQFGTGENGAKACRNKRRVYLLREGEIFPLLLTLPTGSLKAFTKYIKTQLSKGKKSSAVVTRFALKKVNNTGGIAYSQAIFSFDRDLNPEECAAVQPISEQMKQYAIGVGFDTDAAISDDVPHYDAEAGDAIQPLGGGTNV